MHKSTTETVNLCMNIVLCKFITMALFAFVFHFTSTWLKLFYFFKGKPMSQSINGCSKKTKTIVLLLYTVDN